MHIRPIEIGRRLIRAIDAERTSGADGKTTIPNVFIVKLSQADRTALGDLEGPLVSELTDAARQYAEDEGYRLIGEISVSIVTDSNLKAGKTEISAERRPEAKPSTPVVAAQSAPPAPAVPSAPPVPPTTATPAIPPVPTPAPTPAAEKKAVLILADGTKVAVKAGVLSIGRSAESSVPLNDTNVSRRHAEIRSRGEGQTIQWFVVDVGSTNGTMLNGVKVNGEQKLKAGDSLMFGNTSARFEIT